MAKNIEIQGKRPGYIVGGVLALLLSAFLILLYFPDLMSAIFGIDLLWDFSVNFYEWFGSNIMDYINDLGGLTLLGAFFLLYFVCLCARPSSASTMFRLTSVFACVAIALPQIIVLISSFIEGIDLTLYVGYGILGLFILCLTFYICGLVLRGIRKYHKNRASTLLVFVATFWLLLLAVFALASLNDLFAMGMDFIYPIKDVINSNLLAILGIFLFVCAIWQFITIPHRIRVEYNTTVGGSKSGRPQVLQANASQNSAPQQMAPQNNAKFAHNFVPSQNNLAQNPVFNANPANEIATNRTAPQPSNIQPVIPPALYNLNTQQNRTNNFNQPQQPVNNPITQNQFIRPTTPAQPITQNFNNFAPNQSIRPTPNFAPNQPQNAPRTAQPNAVNPFAQRTPQQPTPNRPIQPSTPANQYTNPLNRATPQPFKPNTPATPNTQFNMSQPRNNPIPNTPRPAQPFGNNQTNAQPIQPNQYTNAPRPAQPNVVNPFTQKAPQQPIPNRPVQPNTTYNNPLRPVQPNNYGNTQPNNYGNTQPNNYGNRPNNTNNNGENGSNPM